MDSISAIKLQNLAPYVCQIHFWDVTQNRELDGSGDIPEGQSATISPTNYGANNGDIIQLIMIVKEISTDKKVKASEQFMVNVTSHNAAFYTAHGNAFSPSLHYEGLIQP